MNTNNELERIVQGFMEDRVAEPPRPGALRDAIERTSATPQARRRFLGRWLDRDEGAGRRATEHDPPPNTNRRNRLMLSATGITAALAILAIAVNVSDGDPLVPGQTAATHVVAVDGSGNFETIQAAVDAAADGDTIAIQPGTYAESVTIDKDLTLFGDGPREEIVVAIPADGPSLDPDGRHIGYGFMLDDADTSVSGLTLEGSGLRTIAIMAAGGNADIHDLVVELGPLQAWPRAFAIVTDGADASITDSESNAELVIGDGVSATISGNVTTGPDKTNGLTVWAVDGADVALEGNMLNGVVVEGSTATLAQNELFAPDGCAVEITGKDAVVTASANLIHTSETGICTSGAAAATITDNEIVDNVTGISLGTDASVTANQVHQNDVGVLFRVGAPTVEDNDVASNDVALAFGSLPTAPLVSGNTFCANETSVDAPPDLELPDLSDNETC